MRGLQLHADAGAESVQTLFNLSQRPLAQARDTPGKSKEFLAGSHWAPRVNLVAHFSSGNGRQYMPSSQEVHVSQLPPAPTYGLQMFRFLSHQPSRQYEPGEHWVPGPGSS